jgi:histone H3/H4
MKVKKTEKHLKKNKNDTKSHKKEKTTRVETKEKIPMIQIEEDDEEEEEKNEKEIIPMIQKEEEEEEEDDEGVESEEFETDVVYPQKIKPKQLRAETNSSDEENTKEKTKEEKKSEAKIKKTQKMLNNKTFQTTGLLFPNSKILKEIKEKFADFRVSKTAITTLASVLEFLTFELLSNATRKKPKLKY